MNRLHPEPDPREQDFKKALDKFEKSQKDASILLLSTLRKLVKK